MGCAEVVMKGRRWDFPRPISRSCRRINPSADTMTIRLYPTILTGPQPLTMPTNDLQTPKPPSRLHPRPQPAPPRPHPHPNPLLTALPVSPTPTPHPKPRLSTVPPPRTPLNPTPAPVHPSRPSETSRPAPGPSPAPHRSLRAPLLGNRSRRRHFEESVSRLQSDWPAGRRDRLPIGQARGERRDHLSYWPRAVEEAGLTTRRRKKKRPP